MSLSDEYDSVVGLDMDEDSNESDKSSSDCEDSPETGSEEDRSVELNAIHNTDNVALLKLPREVLSYIFKWVVSDKLDINSLSRCALVCKDFYMHSQDPLLWHVMCQRVWGETVVRKPYLSWQSLFLSRPHVHFHGIYISKTSYVRTGDASITFSYKPYYYVEYFRILRFFPNGEVLMLTTPQDPREIVHQLECKNKKVQGLLLGRYVVHEDKNKSNTVLTAILEKYSTPKDSSRVQSGRNRRSNRITPTAPIYEYRIELTLTSTSSKRKFNKLTWNHHSCCTQYETAEMKVTQFDITRQYPPLFFNKIKSFTAESDCPI